MILVSVILVFAALMLGTEVLLEAVLGPWLPHWLALSILVASVGLAIIGAFVGVLRFMTWRRRTW